MYDVLDEMRRERKILMAIRDAQIEKYIGLDITEVDLADKDSHAELPQEMLFAIQDKLEYREQLSQRTSTMRLNYMYVVLLSIYQRKCTISDPDQFIDKVRALERSDRKHDLRRVQSASSMFSLYSKSQKTGITAVDLEESGSDDDADAEVDMLTNTTSGINNDPVILSLTEVFDQLADSIKTLGEERIQNLEAMYADDGGRSADRLRNVTQ